MKLASSVVLDFDLPNKTSSVISSLTGRLTDIITKGKVVIINIDTFLHILVESTLLMKDCTTNNYFKVC